MKYVLHIYLRGKPVGTIIKPPNALNMDMTKLNSTTTKMLKFEGEAIRTVVNFN